MYGSGAGIGMESIHRQGRQIQEGLQRGNTVFCAAVRGPTYPGAIAQRFGTVTALVTGSATTVFVLLFLLRLSSRVGLPKTCQKSKEHDRIKFDF